jgi:hypothetical protein
MTELPEALRTAAEMLVEHAAHPHGFPVEGNTRVKAGEACVRLCRGNQDKGRTLWKRFVADWGYMPHAAAVALIYAANTDNLVPDIPEPDLDGPR